MTVLPHGLVVVIQETRRDVRDGETRPIHPAAAIRGNTFPNATGTANSGLLVTKRQYKFYQLGGVLPPPVKTYKVTFTAAGTYRYICEIHDEIGMVGTVVVK